MKKGWRQPVMRLVLITSIFLIPGIFFGGCAKEVSWIHAEPKSVELKGIEDIFQIRFTPLDKENKPVPDAKLRFETTNPKVAMVSDTGKITAKGTGNAIISIVSETGEKAVIQCKVAIRAGIKIVPVNAAITVGEKIQLEASVLDEKGALFEDQVVSWASSDKSVARVNDFGEVTGYRTGTAKITGTQIDVYGNVIVTVTSVQ